MGLRGRAVPGCRPLDRSAQARLTHALQDPCATPPRRSPGGGRQPLRSKSYTLDRLKEDIDDIQLGDHNREYLIDYGKRRAKAGAGPVTLGMEIGDIRPVLVHAAAVHDIQVPAEQVTSARVALACLGLIGKGNERDRRLSFDEIERLRWPDIDMDRRLATVRDRKDPRN
mgnify:CR=1 FL=1